MKAITHTPSLLMYFPKGLLLSVGLALGCLIYGGPGISWACDCKDNIMGPTHPLAGDPNKHKSIFVFFDGTKNDPRSGTNVWRLFETLLNNNDPQMTAKYIQGVGSVDHPIFGVALGLGMEENILEGYGFITQQYNPGDDIYIFGFSRGAHQARALAGLLAYAGVPTNFTRDHKEFEDLTDDIIELVKKKSDDDYVDEWASWSPEQAPVLATEIKEELNQEMQPVEVTFLGVWDTVPGSSLKNYDECKEKKGFVKKYLYWLIPGIDKGERYKSGSYPPIRRIAHAVALDEKRSKFAPLLICKPIENANYGTRIEEVWFPGAHADVGGGYSDSDELPNISLAWMINLLEESYPFHTTPHFQGSAKGLAHWSMGDFPANTGSDCIDRKFPDEPQPNIHESVQNRKISYIHESVQERKSSSPVPICWKGTVKHKAYPFSCSENESRTGG